MYYISDSLSSVKTHFQITIIAYFTIFYCSIAPFIHAISLYVIYHSLVYNSILLKCEYIQYKFDEKTKVDFDSNEVVLRVGENYRSNAVHAQLHGHVAQ